MINRSTKDTFGFFIAGIVYGIIGMIYYRLLLFRCFPNMTYNTSKTLLWGMLAASLLAGAILFWYRKTEWSAAASVILPFGIYTVFSYANTARRLLCVSMSIAAVCAVAYTIARMSRKITWARYRKRMIKNRLYECFCVTQYLLATGLAAVMLILCVNRISGSSLLTSSVKAVVAEDSSGQTISDSMEILLLLQEEKWETLDTAEKLNVLQTVANIEASYLGLSNELNVCTSSLKENTLGCYNDDTHRIYIDREHLENDSAREVLDTCCHEAYHSYQYRLVDAYAEASDSAKSLRVYKTAAAYAEEFGNYTEGSDDFCQYYNQTCETDARAYAGSAVAYYYSQIEAYLEENS
ncbi:MAG: hypothetical protein LIP12_07440 [Clostridiales bacterium]|nr:hypothetical protein [Clostridiales bacterium]